MAPPRQEKALAGAAGRRCCDAVVDAILALDRLQPIPRRPGRDVEPAEYRHAPGVVEQEAARRRAQGAQHVHVPARDVGVHHQRDIQPRQLRQVQAREEVVGPVPEMQVGGPGHEERRRVDIGEGLAPVGEVTGVELQAAVLPGGVAFEQPLRQ